MGQKAIITGGSHGIGRGIALVLAEQGYDTVISYNQRERDAQEIRARIEALGRRCHVLRADLSDPAAPEAFMERAIEALGGVDLLVCNAGRTRFSSVLHVSNAGIDELFNLNYRAYLLCCGAAARHMVRAGTRGSILFITSSRAQRACPEDALYGGFKAGIERACASIAIELAPYGIRANCVAPGATAIDIIDHPPASRLDPCIPLGRLGTPREVGEAVAYLASPAGGYITGTTLRLDGGLILPGVPESMPETGRWINPEWLRKQRERMEQEESST